MHSFYLYRVTNRGGLYFRVGIVAFGDFPGYLCERNLDFRQGFGVQVGQRVAGRGEERSLILGNDTLNTVELHVDSGITAYDCLFLTQINHSCHVILYFYDEIGEYDKSSFF